MKYPEDIKKVLENKGFYIEKMLNDKNKAIIYNYGPVLCMNTELPDTVTYNNNSVLKFIMDTAKLIKISNTKGLTYNEFKKYIRNIIVNCNSMENMNDFLSKKMISMCSSIISEVNQYQKDNKQLESMTIDMAPIIGYEDSVLIKNPVSEEERAYTPSETNKNIYAYFNKTAQRIKDIFKTTNINDFEDVIKSILYNNAISIVSECEYYVGYADKEFPIPSNLAKILTLNNGKINMVSIYYFLSCLVFATSPDGKTINISEETIQNIIKAINKANEIVTGDKNVTINSIMESFFDINIGNITNDDVVNLDTIDELEYFNAEKLEKMADKIDTDLNDISSSYPLQKLLNFIHSSLRFEFDDYVKNHFLDDVKIEDYSFLEDNIMICEIENKYLCAPARDLARGLEPVVIIMNREGDIYVIKSLDILHDILD